jgi:hypothetical protein
MEKYHRVDILNGKSINLTINDFRIIPPGSKVKATFGQISNTVEAALVQTYGEDFISRKSAIDVVINIYMYDVTFNAPMWNAHVKYTVKISDKETVIKQDNHKYIFFGFASSEKLLRKCFAGVNMKLITLLRDELAND